ncbi:MAG: recombinase family protein [Caldilineaceae bacterium SB0662_bin_9]|uniref:Recombinase family protein n=1 Tax=Caldilineaceae bacterium SB0662_bin_9 TaxID=2605258 RepID=A0A6B1DRW7_9CHLR|nr:recombinase family protein [Caldilineaceae bacterium SB0662_bin_9]
MTAWAAVCKDHRVGGKLEQHGIKLVSWLSCNDTLTLAGKVLFQICGMFAEFERNLIAERTKAGLTATRARGRKPKMTPEQFDRAASLIRTIVEQSGRSPGPSARKVATVPSICPTARTGR